MINEGNFQIGKKGLTAETILAIENMFKSHSQVRVSVLRSAARDKPTISAMASEICSKLPFNCIFKVIGFTIILRKIRNPKSTNE